MVISCLVIVGGLVFVGEVRNGAEIGIGLVVGYACVGEAFRQDRGWGGEGLRWTLGW